MAEQDDAQRGEGEQEERRGEQRLSGVHGIAASALMRAEGLQGLAGLAEQAMGGAAMVEGARQWLAEQERLSAGMVESARQALAQQDSLSAAAELQRQVLEDLRSMGAWRELMAQEMARSASSLAWLEPSSLADLAQEVARTREQATRAVAELMPAVDTSAFWAALGLGAIEPLDLRTFAPAYGLISPAAPLPDWLISPAAPERPAAPAQPARPAPQPPAPQPGAAPAPATSPAASPILRLKGELQRLSPSDVAIGDALELMAMLADLVHGTGERLPYAGKPEKQREAIAVYEHYLRHKRSHRPEGIAALLEMPFNTWRRRLEAGKVLHTLQFAKTEQKSGQRPA